MTTYQYTAAFLFLIASPAVFLPASIVVEAGQTYTLSADLLVNGDDGLEIRGTAEKPCILEGKQFSVRSGPTWTGSLKNSYCNIRELGGTPKMSAEGLVKGPTSAPLDRQSNRIKTASADLA